SQNIPNSPKQISPTNNRFQKMLLSTPSGRQNSASKKTTASAEINILMVLARLSERISLSDIFEANFSSFKRPVMPKPIKISPSQYPKTIAVIPSTTNIPLNRLAVTFLMLLFRKKKAAKGGI